MARLLPFRKYPPEYAGLFLRAQEITAAGETMVVPVEGNHEARLFRNQLYNFRKAVRMSDEAPEELKELVEAFTLSLVQEGVLFKPNEPKRTDLIRHTLEQTNDE